MNGLIILVSLVIVLGGLGGLISYWDPNVRFLNTKWLGHIFAGIVGAILAVALGIAIFKIDVKAFGGLWTLETQITVLPEIIFIAAFSVLGGYASLSLIPTLSNLALKKLQEEMKDVKQNVIENKETTTRLSAEEHYLKGKIAFNVDNNWDSALFYCEEVLKENPEHANAWATKSRALKRMGKLNEALESAQKAAEYDPDDWRKWFNIACYQSRLGLDFSEIKPTLERCRQIVDKNQESRANFKLLLETDDDLGNLRELEGFKEIFNSI